MMTTYIMIVIIGYQAATLEFPTLSQCSDAQASMVKAVKSDKVAVQCFQKIGQENKL